MTEYKLKSIDIDARKYDSTNGKELANWINTNGGFAGWAEESKGHGLVLPEQLFVSSDLCVGSLKLGMWVVLIEDTFHFYTDEDFQKMSEKV